MVRTTGISSERSNHQGIAIALHPAALNASPLHARAWDLQNSLLHLPVDSRWKVPRRWRLAWQAFKVSRTAKTLSFLPSGP